MLNHCLIVSVIWNVYGECENISVMSGHSGSVMEMHFSPDGSNLYTASTDTTLGLWDLVAGTRIKKLKGHTSFVNSVSGARRGPTLLCSGSDDSTIRVWDPRKRGQSYTLNNTYQVYLNLFLFRYFEMPQIRSEIILVHVGSTIFQVTATSFNDTAEQVISGGVDNDIKVWDLRKNAVLYKLKGHSDTITGLSLSPDGSYILSNAMDNTLRIWDVRPFAPYERCVKILSGHQHNFEKVLMKCYSNLWRYELIISLIGVNQFHISCTESSKMRLGSGWKQSFGWFSGSFPLYLGHDNAKDTLQTTRTQWLRQRRRLPSQRAHR